MASSRSKELYQALQAKGYPDDFCRELAYRQLNTDYTATRMLGYLYRISELRIEDVVDEMLAIQSDRNAIIQKKELEQAQAAINRIRENDMQISQFFVNGDIKGAIDYMRDHEEFKDIAAGFGPSAKSFFSWLGVTYYISAETIDTMLSALSSLCADGSSLLLLDPLYLSVLCGFFGGGDMNGIALLCPEWAAR